MSKETHQYWLTYDIIRDILKSRGITDHEVIDRIVMENINEQRRKEKENKRD